MRRGPRKLQISADAVGLTAFGGVALLHAFVQRLGLQGEMSRRIRFRQRNNAYSISEMLEALLYPLILGLGRVESTEPLRYNGVFQYLAGLPGYPEATTLRRFLLRFAQKGRDKFVSVHGVWRREMLDRPQSPARAILDLDGTVLTVYGQQGGSAIGYNPKKRGRPSYMPLLCFEGRSGDILGGSYHPGNTRAHTVAAPLLRECLSRLPASVKLVAVRADSEFYSRQFIEFIEGNGARYVIVAPLQYGLKSRLGGLPYRRVSAGVFAAEFQYTPHRWGRARRFIVIRRPVPEEPSAQLHLFQMQGFTYQAFITNMSLRPLNLWRFYNRRATAELVIRELKDAYALGKIPTKDLSANEGFFQIVLLAYNLLNWFKRLAAPPDWQRMTLQRLRQRLLFVPAQLVHPAGVPTLRIMPSYLYSRAFLDILGRIEKLKPLSDSRTEKTPSRLRAKPRHQS
jgi:hypothetical protein